MPEVPPIPPSPRKAGRPFGSNKPYKLTETAKKNLLAAIEAGATRTAACAAARVPQRTYSGWMMKASKGMEPYASFFADIDAAKARFEIRNISVITEAAASKTKNAAGEWVDKPSDWKAAAWLLEHNRYTGPRYRMNRPTKLDREAAQREAERHAREMGAEGVREVRLVINEASGAVSPEPNKGNAGDA